jgi:hypothetical protein
MYRYVHTYICIYTYTHIGDFQALKQAQDRSDVLKIYSNGINDSNKIDITYDITLSIMDFLLSDNGKFLFDPLITEIVDIIDALGNCLCTYMNVLLFYLFTCTCI